MNEDDILKLPTEVSEEDANALADLDLSHEWDAEIAATQQAHNLANQYVSDLSGLSSEYNSRASIGYEYLDSVGVIKVPKLLSTERDLLVRLGWDGAAKSLADDVYDNEALTLALQQFSSVIERCSLNASTKFNGLSVVTSGLFYTWLKPYSYALLAAYTRNIDTELEFQFLSHITAGYTAIKSSGVDDKSMNIKWNYLMMRLNYSIDIHEDLEKMLIRVADIPLSEYSKYDIDESFAGLKEVIYQYIDAAKVSKNKTCTAEMERLIWWYNSLKHKVIGNAAGGLNSASSSAMQLAQQFM